MNGGDDLHEALVAAADESSPCQRVLRNHEGRKVATTARDFYRALRTVEELVVRVTGAVAASDVPATADYRSQPGFVEFTTTADHDPVLTGRENFEQAVRVSDDVEVLDLSESWFTHADRDDPEVRADGGIPTVEDSYGVPAPAEVDGVDLKREGCPVCGSEAFDEYPAGHYHCQRCWCGWGGDPENASIETYFGPSPSDLTETGTTLPVDIDEKCAACCVRPTEPDTRHCESCHDALLADGGVDVEGSVVVEDAVLDALDQHSDDHGHAPVGAVVADVLGDIECGVAAVCSCIRRLHATGVIYQPNATDIARVETDGGAEDDRVECVECSTETPEGDAFYAAGDLDEDALDELAYGESIPVSELFTFADGPYCSLDCLTETGVAE